MVKLHVLAPGALSTIQDLGREGYREFGLPIAGAMDPRALAIANLLAGNPTSEAALEITLLGPILEIEGEGVLALAGGDLGAQLNDWPLSANGSFAVRSGDKLRFTGPRRGCRAYLAMAGGFDLPQALGSRSTYVRGALGGLEGRSLAQGDVLSSREPQTPPQRLGALPPRFTRHLTPKHAVARVILGPQDDFFDDENLALFFETSWQIGNEADRMGYRLTGATLKHRDRKEIVSDGVLSGAIQVPGHGAPIVLLADAQTTGGYPKIATVIGADLGVFGQLMPGDTVRFEQSTPAKARQALLDAQATSDALAIWLAKQPRAKERRFSITVDGKTHKATLQKEE